MHIGDLFGKAFYSGLKNQTCATSQTMYWVQEPKLIKYMYRASRISTLWGFHSPESSQSSLNCLFSPFCFEIVSCSLCFGCGMSKAKKFENTKVPCPLFQTKKKWYLYATETICVLDPWQLSSYFKIRITEYQTGR